MPRSPYAAVGVEDLVDELFGLATVGASVTVARNANLGHDGSLVASTGPGRDEVLAVNIVQLVRTVPD